MAGRSNSSIVPAFVGEGGRVQQLAFHTGKTATILPAPLLVGAVDALSHGLLRRKTR